jgi:hypothetical protein
VLCVSSGISALLINGGCTAHSMFKIPIDGLHDRSVCSIQRNSHWGELMRAAHAIIWDEVSAQHRHAVEAVERTLRDVRDVDRPDSSFRWFNCHCRRRFSSNAPCGPKGSREDIVDACIQRSQLSSWVQSHSLGQQLPTSSMVSSRPTLRSHFFRC